MYPLVTLQVLSSFSCYLCPGVNEHLWCALRCIKTPFVQALRALQEDRCTIGSFLFPILLRLQPRDGKCVFFFQKGNKRRCSRSPGYFGKKKNIVNLLRFCGQPQSGSSVLAMSGTGSTMQTTFSHVLLTGVAKHA